MNARDILEEAAGLQSQLVAIRRDLHQHPELGFDLKYTKELVRQDLLCWQEAASLGKLY